MNDFIKRMTSWKTTVLGIVTAIISILVISGVLDPENNGVEVVSSFWDGAVQVLAAVSGLILLFSKDSDVEIEK